MIILHIASLNMKRANGIRYSVPALVSNQNKIIDIKSGLLNTSNIDKLDFNEIESFDFYFVESAMSIKKLKKPFNKPDLIVFHSLYNLTHLPFYREAIKNEIPYIITPRVSLTKQAQKQSFIKKKIANIIIFNKIFKRAKAIHYLTENERKESIIRGLENDYLIVGNGIEKSSLIPENYKNDRYNTRDIKILFIGRYDLNHKGLDILLQSVYEIKEVFRERKAVLKLFGTGNTKEIEWINNFIDKNNIKDIVSLNGPIYGTEKTTEIRTSDLFIHTSRFEGHSMAIIEAMANGIAVIVTPGTNIIDTVVNNDLGWVSKLSIYELSKVLKSAIYTSKHVMYAKGANARKYVENYCTWDIIAFNTVQGYKRILQNDS